MSVWLIGRFALSRDDEMALLHGVETRKLVFKQPASPALQQLNEPQWLKQLRELKQQHYFAQTKGKSNICYSSLLL